MIEINVEETYANLGMWKPLVHQTTNFENWGERKKHSAVGMCELWTSGELVCHMAVCWALSLTLVSAHTHDFPFSIFYYHNQVQVLRWHCGVMPEQGQHLDELVIYM